MATGEAFSIIYLQLQDLEGLEVLGVHLNYGTPYAQFYIISLHAQDAGGLEVLGVHLHYGKLCAQFYII